MSLWSLTPEMTSVEGQAHLNDTSEADSNALSLGQTKKSAGLQTAQQILALDASAGLKQSAGFRLLIYRLETGKLSQAERELLCILSHCWFL